MVENHVEIPYVQIRVALPVLQQFTQQEWNAYQEEVWMQIQQGVYDHRPDFNGQIHTFNLPVAVLRVVGLPSGVNARLPEMEAHRLLGMLMACAHAYAEDEAENKGKGK